MASRLIGPGGPLRLAPDLALQKVAHNLSRGHVPLGGKSAQVVFDDAACRLAGPGETPDAAVAWGPGTSAGILRVTVDPARTPAGGSVAPRVGAALTVAARHLDIPIDELKPFVDVFA